MSRFGEGDVLVSDSQAEALATLQHIIGTPALSDNPGDRWRQRQIDRHHASAALLAHADALVTTDEDDLLSKSRAIWDACELRVIDPETALAQLDREGSLGDGQSGRVGRCRTEVVGEDCPELPAVHEGHRYPAHGGRIDVFPVSVQVLPRSPTPATARSEPGYHWPLR